jgi:hypothetical protein
VMGGGGVAGWQAVSMLIKIMVITDKFVFMISLPFIYCFNYP